MKGNTILSSSKTTASIQPGRSVLRGLQYFLGNHLPELFLLLFEWGAGISAALQKKNWHLGGKWDISLSSNRRKEEARTTRTVALMGKKGFHGLEKMSLCSTGLKTGKPKNWEAEGVSEVLVPVRKADNSFDFHAVLPGWLPQDCMQLLTTQSTALQKAEDVNLQASSLCSSASKVRAVTLVFGV